jgi:hypothetical protein
VQKTVQQNQEEPNEKGDEAFIVFSVAFVALHDRDTVGKVGRVFQLPTREQGYFGGIYLWLNPWRFPFSGRV